MKVLVDLLVLINFKAFGFFLAIKLIGGLRSQLSLVLKDLHPLNFNVFGLGVLMMNNLELSW